ncbi:nucleoside deaminase [Rickettsiales bacterium LUAb2]
MKMLDHNFYINLAIQEANKAAAKEEVPVGAIIVNSQSGEIIAKAHNQVITKSNPVNHAEILAISRAAKKINNYRLNGYSLYSTLEPCPMCAGAIIHARLDCIYFGANDKKGGAVISKLNLFDKKWGYNHQPKIADIIKSDVCGDILKTFFKKLRDK